MLRYTPAQLQTNFMTIVSIPDMIANSKNIDSMDSTVMHHF